MKQKDGCGDISGILPNTDKKRKRTSIAAPEKRLLEDYFRWTLLLILLQWNLNSKSQAAATAVWRENRRYC